MAREKMQPENKSIARVRLSDIARTAGVSRGVAGHVLNGAKGNSRVAPETAERILRIARSMNYQPNPAAQQLRGKRTNIYGILVASAGDPLRSFLVQHLDTEAVKTGCHTIIANTIGREDIGPNQFDYCTEEFARRAVDGVFCAVHPWFAGNRDRLLELHPHTVFYEDPGVAEAHVVEVDRYAAVRLAVRHLIERGRRRIALAVSDLSKPSCQERLRGFRDEHEAYNLEPMEGLVFDAGPLNAPYAAHNLVSMKWDFPQVPIVEAVDRLIRDGGADAIVCNDDFWAASFVRQLRARGVEVPHHVAVVGYLNHYLADWTDPPLTTIDLRQDIAARKMLEMMERRIKRGPLPEEQRRVLIKPKLIVREST